MSKDTKNVSQLPDSYKQSIAEALKNHLSETGMSLERLGTSIKSLLGQRPSKAYLSHIQNGRFQVGKTLISDKDFKLLGEYFTLPFENKIWRIVKTDSLLDCFATFANAQKVQMPICLHGETGTGKSTAATAYVKGKSSNSFYTRCKQELTKKEFVESLCKSVNVPYQSSSARSMELIAKKMKATRNPIFIIDEAEHLNASKFNLLKSLYDETECRLGIVLIMTTDEYTRFRKKAQKGMGTFPQIFSRLAGTSRTMISFDLQEDLPMMCEELGILTADWFTKSAYNWLIDKGNIKEYRTLRKYIEFAYAEYEETLSPITSDDMEILFPSNNILNF